MNIHLPPPNERSSDGPENNRRRLSESFTLRAQCIHGVRGSNVFAIAGVQIFGSPSNKV